MTKRMLWYVCLGLLCCGALAMVVFAAAGQATSTPGTTPLTVKAGTGTGTGNAAPPAVAVDAAQLQLQKYGRVMDVSKPTKDAASQKSNESRSPSIFSTEPQSESVAAPLTANITANTSATPSVDDVYVKELNVRYYNGEKLSPQELTDLRAVNPNLQRRSEVRPGNPLDQGGETCATATVIGGLPYADNGTTVGYVNDYDYACPYTGSTSADVVYSYTPSVNESVTWTLCTGNTDYDSKLYIYAGTCTGTPIACNDDACSSPVYTSWVSRLDCIPLTAGITYYIVVDGYGGVNGNYYLNADPCVPCDIVCQGGDVIECAAQGPDSVSQSTDCNGGCNNSSGSFLYQTLNCGETVCGDVFTYLNPSGSQSRDTDWYQFTITQTMDVTWSVNGEVAQYGYILDNLCPPNLLAGPLTSAPCVAGSVTAFALAPGTYVAWTGPTVFTGIVGRPQYRATLTCVPAVIPTGRCCYNSGANCQDGLTEAECAALTGSWAQGLDCINNPCPTVPHHDLCTTAEVIPSLPYTDTDDNTGATLDCPALGYRSVWYQFTTTTTCDLAIRYCGTSPAFSNAFIVLETACPCSGTWTFASTWENTSCGDGNWSIYWYALPPGTYWAPILTDVGAEGPYTVSFACTQVTTGRCCYNQNNSCADNTLSQCNTLGGNWTDGLNCAANPCPPPPPCTPDFVVTAPYNGQANTCGSGNDCALVASEEHIYQVTIPTTGQWMFKLCDDAAVFWDSYLRIGTACCLADVWSQDDGCSGANYYLSQTPLLTLNAGTYWVHVEGLYAGACGLYTLDISSPPPCDVVSTGDPEGEDCTDPDDYNGGCNSTPQIWQSIQCGAHIAGTSYFDGSTRDTDWYELVAATPNDYTLTVTAEFDLQILIITNADCNAPVYVLNTGGPCQTVSVSTGPVPAGTYWFWVGPQFTSVFACGEYDMTVTAASPCECLPATDLTVFRSTTFPDSVRVSWYASQTQGYYHVFGTTEKNNDGDPDNGADPQWFSVAMVPAPAVAGAQFIRHAPMVSYMNYVVVHDCAPRGRCCYGDPGNPSCASPVTQAQCDALSGAWTTGLNCTDNPCPILAANDNCSSVTPQPCPINATGDNTLATPDSPCLGNGYPETWHAFTINETSTVTVTECGLSGNWQNFYWVVTTGCPCTGYILRDTYTFPDPNCPNGGIIFGFAALPAGTYYIPVLQDASLGAIGPYSISVTCTPYVPPACNVDFTLTAPGNVSGNLTGAPDECNFRAGSDQQVEVTIPTTGQWTFSLCPGSGWDTYLFLATACCGGQLAANDDFCGLTSEIPCYQLTAGTYYVDVEPYGGTTGAWTLVVSQCGGGGSYCAASHSYCDEYISNVLMGSINNTTACTAGGYNDYTGISTTMTVGVGVAITVTNPVPYSTDATGVWVDWNNNFLFTDAGEYTLLTNVNGIGATFTGTITAPAGSAGSHRMRVRIGYSWTPNPCGSTTYGETEDYTLVVQ